MCYIYRPCKILFPCNFQRTFTKVIFTFTPRIINLSFVNLARAFSYLYRQLVLYTYFYASPRIELFGITNSGYCRHNNSILAYSPLERLLPRPPDRNFDTHNNQYNDLNLVIFTSAPNLTNQTHDPLTSILASHFASYIVSQQFAKPLH